MAREIKAVRAVSIQPATQTDTTHPAAYAAVADGSGDTVHDVGDASELTATITVHTEPTGTSPTLDVKLQESNDEDNWVDLDGAAISQLTGGSQASTVSIKVPGPAVTDAKTFARYVRIMAAVGGSDTPTYSATYYLYPKE